MSVDLRKTSNEVKAATNAIAVLAGMFLVFGVLLKKLEGHADSEQLKQFNSGRAYTVGELKQKIRRTPIGLLVTNLTLSLIMLASMFWSKKAPLAERLHGQAE